jgi:hypothetical protein
MGEGGQVADLVHHGGDTFLVRWRDELFGEYFTTHGTFEAADGGAPSRFSMVVNRETITGQRAPAEQE